MRQCQTFRITLHVAGDLAVIRQACREFTTQQGTLCVTVKPETFVYPHGAEQGAEIGLLIYPRFPDKSREELWRQAVALLMLLIERGCQRSGLACGDDVTKWFSAVNETK